MTGILRALLFCLSALLPVIAANAHPVPTSEVRLLATPGALQADFSIPFGELISATGLEPSSGQTFVNRATRYLSLKVEVRTPDGRAWSGDFETVEWVDEEGAPALEGRAVFTPPPGSGARRFTLDWNAVVDRVPSHIAMVTLQSDLSGDAHEPRLLGALRNGSTTLAVDLGQASNWKELVNSMWLGAVHILEGYDHLLFLLALLIPAPLVARNGRWSEGESRQHVGRYLIAIVTAFTVGHSLTLVTATLLGARLPGPPVEILIGLSVLVTAIHAWRPIFAGREPLIALGFGLIHGLAFATLIANIGVGSQAGAIALFGFNLGIEIVQLVLVLAVAPCLFLIHRAGLYRRFRQGAAIFAGAAAMAWIVNRGFGTGDFVIALIDQALIAFPLVIFGLAIFVLVTRRRSFSVG